MKAFLILINVACFCDIISTQSDVRLPPTLTKWPQKKEIWYTRGEEISLQCGAEGTPAVRYEWKKNGFHLNVSMANIRMESNGRIKISRATVVNEGYYQCFASNLYGTTISLFARMRYIEKHTAGPVSQKTVVEGMPFHIEAKQRISFPVPLHEWHIGSDNNTRYAHVGHSHRIQVANNGDLHFAYSLPEDGPGDGRMYRCTTWYFYSKLDTTQSFTQLRVTRNSTDNISQFAPTLAFSSVLIADQEPLLSVTQAAAFVGYWMKLRCFFYGFPEPKISWRRPTNAVPTKIYSLDDFNSTLIIYRVAASDEGNYSCIGTNTKGDYAHTFEIRVEAKPKFTSKIDGPYNVNVTEGESVNFNCNAIAKPDANIAWLKNGQPIDPGNLPERFAFSNNKKSLTIRDVCRDCVDRETKTDLMVIQCNASNVHGYVFAQGYLNVLTKTKVTMTGEETVFVDFQEKQQFIFQCTATSDPSTPAIVRWYKTEPFNDLVRNDPPYVYVATDTLIIRTLPNCSSECAKYIGEYRCVGDNGYSRDNQTIRISYRYNHLLADDITTNDEIMHKWSVILVPVAVGIVLLLSGVFIYNYWKRRHGDFNRQTEDKNARNHVNIYEDVGLDSTGLPLEEMVGCNKRSMRRDSGEYEHIGYDSIDQVMEEIDKREAVFITNSFEVQGQSIYESIDDPQSETKGRARPTLGKDITCDEIEHLKPLEVTVTKVGKDQQQLNYYESVHERETEQLRKSNQQEVSSTTYTYDNHEGNSPDVGLGNANLIRKEANSQFGPLSKYMNQYQCLGRKEENQYTDLNTDKSENNQYLYMVASAAEAIQDLYLVPKDMNQYGNLDVKEFTQNVDHGQKEECMDMEPKEANQCMDMEPKEVMQCKDVELQK